MKLGVFVSAYFDRSVDAVAGTRRVVELAQQVERLGFHSVMLGHHYLSSAQFLQPIPVLGRLAGETEQVQLGLGVYLAPLANPLVLAEELATVEALSGGRLVVGLGAGYRRREFAALGIPFEERFRRFEENVGVVSRLLAGEAVDHVGAFGVLEGATVELRSPRPGGPPIWLGAFGDIGIRRSARLGAAWLAGPEGDVAELARRREVYAAGIAAAGRTPPPDAPMSREVFVARTDAEARAIARPHLEAQYRDYKSWEHGLTIDALMDDVAVVGSPESVLARLRRYAELGFTEVIARVEWPGMRAADVSSSLELLAAEVLPGL